MARCPFALDAPVGYGPGTYAGGPWRVVWHKTQGATFAGALAAYRARQVAPHFTVDEAGQVRQHFDTAGSAYAVVHNGQPDTNRLHAIQIEVVGFCGQTMNPAQLDACLALAAWIDRTHGVPPVWPLGRPTGHDSRDAAVWVGQSGHYGHSNVPENDHTDPAWTDAEWLALAFAAPPAPPAPAPAPPAPVPPVFFDLDGVPMVSITVTVPTDADGNGWTDQGAHPELGTVDVAKMVAATVQGSAPARDGRYWPGSAHWQDEGGHPLVSVTGALPNAQVNVFVVAAT